jgi:predicted enzyme related to lactoylglutathione lyase
MSERETYPHGVPCWVDLLVDDPERATAFYRELFGWEFAGPGPMPDGGGYHVARLNGADAAGVGSAPPRPPDAPGVPAAWNTYVSVDSADAIAQRARTAGGTVLAGPFDAPPAGRGVVIEGPDGSVICAWEAGDRQGAQRVNEPSAWAMSLLQTTDAGVATRFYGEVFGWEPWTPPGDDAPPVVLFRLPGYVGGEPSQPVPRDVIAAMLEVPAPPAPGVRAMWSVDFWIADADAAAAVARERGGTVLAEPHEAPPFRRTVLADPFGAAFSVSQLRVEALAS